MGLSTNCFPTETNFFLSNKQSETVSVLFNEMLHYMEINFERQVSRVGELLQPILPNKNVTFSVMMVEGVKSPTMLGTREAFRLDTTTGQV